MNTLLTALTRRRAVDATARANPTTATTPHPAQYAARIEILRPMVAGFLRGGHWDAAEIRDLLNRTWFRNAPPTAGELEVVEEAIRQAGRG